jgi:uncharacterized protein YbjT (DUF2867 family)
MQPLFHTVRRKILLLGATGRTGQHVLHQAIDMGYQVHVLVRDQNRLPLLHEKLWVFEGDTRIERDLKLAMEGCDAVISCLNISRKSDFPWSPLRTPEDFVSSTIKNVISCCKGMEINRLIAISAWGVAESRAFIPGWFGWLIDNSNLSAAYLEHERQEALIRSSPLDWTLVRPVALTNCQKSKAVKVLGQNQKPSLTISRKDTAKFLLDALEDEGFFRSIATIYS